MGDVGQVNDGNKVAREPEREPSKDPNYLIDGKKHDNGQINSGPAGNGDDNQFNIDETINDGNAGHINQIMMQGNAQRGMFQTKNQKDLQARQELMRSRSNTLVPLTMRRPGTLDPYELSYQLVYDINILSTQIFSLWYKYIEIITVNPKFVCEYLRIIHEEKMREYWGELIYRTVFETSDFTAPSTQGHNVQEIHRTIAMKRRGLIGEDKDHALIKSSYTDLNIIEISEQLHATSGPAGQALSAELRKLQTKQALRSLQNLQPIIFEECFVKNMAKLK